MKSIHSSIQGFVKIDLTPTGPKAVMQAQDKEVALDQFELSKSVMRLKTESEKDPENEDLLSELQVLTAALQALREKKVVK